MVTMRGHSTNTVEIHLVYLRPNEASNEQQEATSNKGHYY